MEEKIVEVKGKKITVNEVKFVDTFKPEISEKIKLIGYAPAMLSVATSLTDEEINNLSKKDGQKIWKVYTELNEDFQDSEAEINE